MGEIIAWFSKHYPELKRSMQKCEHGEEQINPYHIEGDCWSHTMITCKIAELKSFSTTVCIAALLHDIGKPKSRKVNSKNGYVQFFGHEELSSIEAKPILEKMAQEGLIKTKEIDYILDLIRYHGLAYKLEPKELQNQFNNNFYNDLMDLSLCDNLGRFHTK